MLNSWKKRACCLALAACIPFSVLAERGVTANEIKIGASRVLSGPLGPQTTRISDGAQLLFDEINESGGIHGRKINFIQFDDQFQVPLAVENTKKLISEEQVFMLFNSTGTGQTAAILPLLSQTRTVLFGPITGASAFRQKVNPYLFHVRASYADEAEKMVSQMALIGLTKVAMAYQEDPFGNTLLNEIELAAKRHNVELIAKIPLDTSKTSYTDEARKLASLRPQALVLGGAGLTVPRVIAAVQATEAKPTFYGFSVASLGAINGVLKENARGIVLARIMPSLRNSAVSVVRDYLALLEKRKPGAQPSADEFEGYVHARLLVAALEKAGPDLTTPRLIDAIESLKEVAWGSFRARYSSKSHNGSAYVELAIINREGRLMY